MAQVAQCQSNVRCHRGFTDATFAAGNEYQIFDLAGHGYSGHRPKGVSYHFIDMLFECLEIINNLGLNKLSLLGHSMGAGLASCLAGIIKDNINFLILIEGLGPMAIPSIEISENLKASFADWNNSLKKEINFFKSKDEAIRIRHLFSDMSEVSVKTLLKRGLKKTSRGFIWRNDPKLKIKSRLYLNEEQVVTMLKNITAPVLLIESKDSKMEIWKQLIKSRIGIIKNLEHKFVTGGHHPHLENPEEISKLIKIFVENNSDKV